MQEISEEENGLIIAEAVNQVASLFELHQEHEHAALCTVIIKHNARLKDRGYKIVKGAKNERPTE